MGLADGSCETAVVSMMALIAKAVPVSSWQEVQWQPWTIMGGKLTE
jgi:hypothetical protein